MRYRMRLTVMALAALLSACGDGHGPRTSAVRVAGDSLSDSGTFGFKATVQGGSLADTRIWIDHVAEATGVAALCPRYVAPNPQANPDDVRLDPRPGAADCTSHAVVGARINVPDAALGGDSSPFSIPRQLGDLAAAASYGPQELLLLDGGGNDLADLMRGYLTMGQDSGAAYLALLGELLTPAQVGAAGAAGQAGLAQAGALYMGALANAFADQIAAQALGQGARRVVLLNLPDLTRTPYFRLMLAGVEQASGQAAAAGVEAMATGWMQAFNSGLQARFVNEPRVAMVDFHAAMRLWSTPVVADLPNLYGFTNTTDPACPPAGVDAMQLSTYFLGNCFGSALSASRPADPAWWTTYVFSDDFHGSPMTNRLMADLVRLKLRERGWL